MAKDFLFFLSSFNYTVYPNDMPNHFGFLGNGPVPLQRLTFGNRRKGYWGERVQVNYTQYPLVEVLAYILIMSQFHSAKMLKTTRIYLVMIYVTQFFFNLFI